MKNCKVQCPKWKPSEDTTGGHRVDTRKTLGNRKYRRKNEGTRQKCGKPGLPGENDHFAIKVGKGRKRSESDGKIQHYGL